MGNNDYSDQLFTALAEQLKVPLLQIARLSELGQDATSPRITAISEHALRLVDAYTQVSAQSQMELVLEPVATSAVLYDVAHELEPFAKQHGYRIDIDLQGKSVPVMTHRHSLTTLMSLLAASFIEVGADEAERPRSVVLGTHRSAQGTVVGTFSSHNDITQRAVQLTRELHGRATQAVPSLGLSGGAGLAIADLLGSQMATPLKAYRHHNLTGLGTLLSPSGQLQLLA